ncbi:hypothetical protein LJB99_02535 [Deltaproteobacteria bacterium OttesenSCG-928-K17]|nr:hypothetical protein [Deltaproteobacteria bacterium OttesenSCG-928-K17]
MTIDTDWAPEEATRAVLEKVRALGVKTTVFFSTPNPLEDWPLLETGCHPDLSRRRTPFDESAGLGMASMQHDRAVDLAEADILARYRQAMPGARAVRTHRFYWHSDLARNMAANGFEHDSSMILPYQPGLKGFKSGRLTRWPVWASDHLHLARRLPFDSLRLPNFEEPGLKIFCFHVAYLYLNASSLDDFNMIQSRLDNADGGRARSGPGVWNLFEMLAGKILEKSQGRWLSEIPPEYVVTGR